MQIGNQEIENRDFLKMRDFIDRLFTSPNFSPLPIPEVEGVLISFLQQNQQQLSGTFATPEYYPQLTWRDVQILFLSVLKELTLEKMKPQLMGLINSKINFKSIAAFYKNPNYDFEAAAQQTRLFLDKIILNRDVRQGFNITFKLLEHDYIDKYMDKVFERREHLFNMLTRQDSLQHLKQNELADFIKTVLLLRNVVYMKLPVAQGNDQSITRMNLFDVWNREGLKKSFLKKLESTLQMDFMNFPEQIIKAAIDSNRDCNEEIEILSAVSRFVAIISKRGKDYAPWIKVDKGAEQPDKSWFRVALKNHLFHGIDKMMLEEFFKIAADENW